MIIKFTEAQFVPKSRRRYGVVVDDIEIFVRAAQSACEIDISPYKSGSTAHACYYNAVKRLGLTDRIAVTLRSGRLYLVKKEAKLTC